MTFDDAMIYMREGQKVRRSKWGKAKYWRMRRHNEELELLHKDDNYSTESFFLMKSLPLDAIMANDWEVVIEQKEK